MISLSRFGAAPQGLVNHAGGQKARLTGGGFTTARQRPLTCRTVLGRRRRACPGDPRLVRAAAKTGMAGAQAGHGDSRFRATLERISVEWNRPSLSLVIPAQSGNPGLQPPSLALGPRFRGDDGKNGST